MFQTTYILFYLISNLFFRKKKHIFLRHAYRQITEESFKTVYIFSQQAHYTLSIALILFSNIDIYIFCGVASITI